MIFLVFIFGLIIGSFLNAVIYRFKIGKSIIKSRSYCPLCKQQLKWYELIPLLSFIIQLGRCRSCKQKIDYQYPIVELMTAILFSIAFLNILNYPNFQLLTPSFQIFRDFFFISALIVIFVYDFKWQIIPDKVTIPAIGIILVFNLIILFSSQTVISQELLKYLLAILVGGGFFLLQFLISRGRWIGGGDIRLGILMGVMLGWPSIIWALMLAYILGAIVSLILIVLRQKTFKSQIPFGTFLTLASFVILYWGNSVVEWYLNLF